MQKKYEVKVCINKKKRQKVKVDLEKKRGILK